MGGRAAAALSLGLGLAAIGGVAQAADDAVKDDPRLNPAEQMDLADERILVGLQPIADGYLAVGMRGHILKSADGQTWNQQPSPVRSMLVTIDFPTESTGFIGGHDGTILKTTDGGDSWSLQHFNPEPRRPVIIYDLMFDTPERGFAVGSYGLILRTTDGGDTWNQLTPDIEFLGFHNSQIRRLANGVLLMVGEKGLTARSGDDGETWEMLVSPYSGSFFGLIPDDRDGAWIYGMRGRLYRIPDVMAVATQNPMDYDPFMAENVEDPAAIQAMGWERIQTPANESFFGATTRPDGGITLVGNAGLILNSDAQQANWTLVPNPNGDTLAGVVPVGGKLLTVGRQGVEWH